MSRAAVVGGQKITFSIDGPERLFRKQLTGPGVVKLKRVRGRGQSSATGNAPAEAAHCPHWTRATRRWMWERARLSQAALYPKQLMFHLCPQCTLCIANGRRREEKHDLVVVEPGRSASGWRHFELTVPQHEGMTISSDRCRIITVTHYVKVREHTAYQSAWRPAYTTMWFL